MKRHYYPFRAMGSPCHLNFYAKNRAVADTAHQRARTEVERIETTYSRYLGESALSRLNREAHTPEGGIVDDEFGYLLDYAGTCFDESDGLFDISSGVLRKVWNFLGPHQLPDQRDIESLLPSIGFDALIRKGNRVWFKRPGMEIDFGGIAKEYAADRVASILEDHGIHHGTINFGGDLCIIGPHPDGTPWDVGIHHPRRKATLIASLTVDKGAVATSGDYERAIVIDGTYYSHILNPHTGWPTQGLQSVSVVAPLALIAGSASTIAMLKGSEGALWLEELGLPCLWVDEVGSIHQRTG